VFQLLDNRDGNSMQLLADSEMGNWINTETHGNLTAFVTMIHVAFT
jgi:hypothetical protein